MRIKRNKFHDADERFWQKVEKFEGEDACWIWRGSTKASGYGSFGMGGRSIGAHRAAWRLTHGAIPKGVFVCHKCDNPPCVRPEHLFLATAQGNVDDKIRKGRSKHGRPIEDVRAIRKAHADGEPARAIAKRFDCHWTTIWRIVNRGSYGSDFGDLL